MIASVAFRKFKALRKTQVALLPFNLVIGPNGSGKTSLIESLLRLRTLAPLPQATARRDKSAPEGPQITFKFEPPHDALTALISCTSEEVCNLLEIHPPEAADWPALRTRLALIRGYVLDHSVMGAPAKREDGASLASDGHNLAAVLARMSTAAPDEFSALTAHLLRIMPEFHSLELVTHPDGRVEFGLRLAEDGLLTAAELSQGMLYLLAILTLAFDPAPPPLLCIEEVDRGIHPRTLREIRDALYRLSYPKSFGLQRAPVQIVATTHSPYLIDQFREHPEEIVISQKHGRAARFERLSDRADLPELLREGSLGDMWFSGILGGVPDEP
ncbi:MAG: AAA family ATPase [Opitutaceae bacterium]|nr:AAA family ATPase [Opitutaceae bacterium]